jgi:casein kinase 1
MMVYLIKGELPWQTKSKANDNRRWQTVFTQKKSILDEELFNGCPKQMQQIFAYVKSLKFDEKPDYEYIKDTIQKIRIENSLRMKMFDWQIIERRHKSLDKRKTEDESSKVLRRRKTTKKKKIKDSVKILAMATIGSLPGREESHEGARKRLPLRKATRTSGNIQDLSSNSSVDRTVKDSFPEFIHRNNIFNELNKFRMLYAFSD